MLITVLAKDMLSKIFVWIQEINVCQLSFASCQVNDKNDRKSSNTRHHCV